MVGANQCEHMSEWTSELPNRTVNEVGFGEIVLSLIKTHIRSICCYFDMLSELCKQLTKVVPRVSRPL